jgi:hypothetical protein
VNACGFFGGGFAKDQEIISKKEVVDGWSGFGDFQAFDVTNSFFFEQQSRQNFNTQDKQKRREGISLPKAFFRGKKSKRTAIDKNGERGRGDTNSDLVNPRRVKP